jgi:glycine oxidase
MPGLNPEPRTQLQPDILVIGAGVIGLSLALELNDRGAHVTILERDTALQHASTAAAGMLAAHDPHNPSAILPLAEHSLTLYPAFLNRIAALSDDKCRLTEHSLDPRQLATALLAAVRNTSIHLREHTEFKGQHHAGILVYTTGAWTPPWVTARKGQMLRVQLPPTLRNLREVHRSEHIYIVPRTTGPQAGTALLGATVEDAGFDTSTNPLSLHTLRALAAELLPAFAEAAQQLEAWAGLRPATVDQLPIVSRAAQDNTFFATGHFRNGILLAPATAQVVADLIEGKQPQIDLNAFSSQRFELNRTSPPIFARSQVTTT